MRIEVVSFNESGQFCSCNNLDKPDDNFLYIDLEVSGKLPEGVRQKDLIGKKFFIHEMQVYMYIANALTEITE